MDIKFSHYGENRDLNCTDEELEIFEQLCTLSGADDIELYRRSDSYVTAQIGVCDVARFKYTNRTKWILFPYVHDEKIRISSTDLAPLSELIAKAVEVARKMNE